MDKFVQSNSRLPINIFDNIPKDQITDWDPGLVTQALIQQRKIEPDAAWRISQEVEGELKRQQIAYITPQVITSVLDDQLVKQRP